MKKKSSLGFMKPALIIILFLGITGLVLVGAGICGMYFGDGETDIPLSMEEMARGIGSGVEYTEFIRTASPDDITEIKLDFDNYTINVVRPVGRYEGLVALVVDIPADDIISGTNENGVFEVTHKQKNRIFNFDLSFLFDDDDHRVATLYIPERYCGDINIKTSNGAINIEGFSGLRDVTLKSSNGRISADELDLTSLEIKTSNGSLELGDIIAEEDITAETSNGKIEAESVRAHDSLSLVTSNGRITVEDIDSDKLYLKSSNGRIEGRVAGERRDFTIKSSTSNGKNSLGEGGSGRKTLEVKTSNADIDLGFAK